MEALLEVLGRCGCMLLSLTLGALYAAAAPSDERPSHHLPDTSVQLTWWYPRPSPDDPCWCCRARALTLRPVGRAKDRKSVV